MTIDALKHRDVAQIDRVLEGFVGLVTALTFTRLQASEVYRVFEGSGARVLFGWSR